MANVKEIRDRMRSINDTKKITSAMYLISSNKVRKARKMLEETEPYFIKIQEQLDLIMSHLPPGTEDKFLDIGEKKDIKDRKRGFLIITDDKGLAGAYNHNILKACEEEFKKSDQPPRIYAVGEVGRSHFKKQGYEIAAEFQYTVQNPTISRARDITTVLVDDFLEGKIDELLIVYTMLLHHTLSKVSKNTLLPLSVPDDVRTVIAINPYDINTYEDDEVRELLDKLEKSQLKMLPDPVAVLDNTVPSLLIGYVYSALVEAYCTVQNDRMLAMDAANKNANDMIKDLSILYNRQRQAQITQEITEIVSGARAHKKDDDEDEFEDEV